MTLVYSEIRISKSLYAILVEILSNEFKLYTLRWLCFGFLDLGAYLIFCHMEIVDMAIWRI